MCPVMDTTASAGCGEHPWSFATRIDDPLRRSMTVGQLCRWLMVKTNGRLVDGTGALLPQPARIDGMKFEELCALAAECFGKEMDDLTLHADNAEADNLDDKELDAVLGAPALPAVVVANVAGRLHCLAIPSVNNAWQCRRHS